MRPTKVRASDSRRRNRFASIAAIAAWLLHVGIVCTTLPANAIEPLPTQVSAAGQASALQDSAEPTQGWPAGIQAKTKLPSERSYTYEVEEVDIKKLTEWLAWFGVELPVGLSGKADGWLWVQRGESWSDLGSYRVEAEIRSPNLRIEEQRIDRAVVRLGFADGTWYLSNLSGYAQFDDTNVSAARVRILGTATPSEQELRLSGTAELLDLVQFAKAAGVSQFLDATPTTVDSVPVGETGSTPTRHLSFRASAPLQSLSDLTKWTVKTSFQLPDIPLSGTGPISLVGKLQIQNGKWALQDASLDLGSRPGTASKTKTAQRLLLAGSGELSDNREFNFQLPATELDLGALLNAGKQATAPVQGKLKVVASVAGNQDGIRTAEVHLVAPNLHLTEKEATASVNFSFRTESGGDLTASLQSAEAGSLTAQATWPAPQDSLSLPNSLTVQITNIDLAELSEFAGGESDGLLGIANGQLLVELKQSPRRPQEDLALDSGPPWSCSGELRVQSLGASFDKRLSIAFGNLRLVINKPFETNAADAELRNDSGTLLGNVNTTLDPRGLGLVVTAPSELLQGYSGSIESSNYAFALSPQPASSDSPCSLDGKLTFQGAPQQLVSRADLKIVRLYIGLKEPIELIQSRAQISPDEFRLSTFNLRDNSGRIAGSASISRSNQGEHQLNLGIPNLDLDRDLSDWGVPNVLGGMVAVKVQLRKPASNTDWIDGWNGSVEGLARDLTYRRRPIGSVAFQGTLANGEVNATGSGLILGGGAEVEFSRRLLPAGGQAAESDDSTTRTYSNFGELKLRKVQLRALAAILADRTLASRFGGTSSAQINFNSSPNADAEVSSAFNVERLSLDQHVLVDTASFTANYESGQLSLRNLHGRLLGGTIAANGNWRIGNDSNPSLTTLRGNLHYQFQRCDVQDLLAILSPENEFYDGFLSLTGDVRFSRQVTLSGTVHSSKGSLFGIPVQELDGNVRAYFNASGELRRLDSGNIHGRIAGGRTSAKLNLKNNYGRLGFEAEVAVDSGSMRQLSESLGFDHLVGEGQFDAETKFSSANITSPADLKGDFQCDFSGTSANSIPLLAELNRFFPAVELLDTTISSGSIGGSLNGEQVQIEDILLNSNAFWIVGDGRADLGNSYFDLELLLQTGGGLGDQLVQNGLELTAIELLPEVVLLAEIADLVRNRSLVFRVKGTPNHPNFQLRLGESIAKSIVQQIRRQLLQKVEPLTTND